MNSDKPVLSGIQVDAWTRKQAMKVALDLKQQLPGLAHRCHDKGHSCQYKGYVFQFCTICHPWQIEKTRRHKRLIQQMDLPSPPPSLSQQSSGSCDATQYEETPEEDEQTPPWDRQVISQTRLVKEAVQLPKDWSKRLRSDPCPVVELD